MCVGNVFCTRKTILIFIFLHLQQEYSHLLLHPHTTHAMAIKRSSSILGFLPLPSTLRNYEHSFNTSRWKKLLQLSLSRILLIKNRRAVLVRQLRRDAAQLLRIGQKEKARMRAERFWKEQNLHDAYDKIGQYCELVFANLSTIAELEKCPEDLREPLQTLTFAASSCADLPELQELREMVAKKYGKEFVQAVQELGPDCYVNEKILETFSSPAPSEVVLQALLKKLAEEDDDPSNLQMVLYSGKDTNADDIFAIPHARSCYGYIHPGKAISKIVSVFLHALQGAFKPRHEHVERIDLYDSQTAIARKQSWQSYEDQYTSGQDTTDSLHTSADEEGMQVIDHQPVAIADHPYVPSENKSNGEGNGLRTQRRKGKRSSRSININGGADMVQPTSGSSTNHECEGFLSASAIAQFMPNSFSNPPERPPPPPPHRVASMPTLCNDSPPPVFHHQRSSTLESDRFFTENHDYHVHPKLPQYEDLVARFAALKRQTPQT